MLLRTTLLTVGITFLLLFSINLTDAKAAEVNNDTNPVDTQHNWEESSSNHEVIQTDSHEFSYWKNFIRQTGTCTISLTLKTVVHYCDVHDHTKSKTYLEDTVHSERHS